MVTDSKVQLVILTLTVGTLFFALRLSPVLVFGQADLFDFSLSTSESSISLTQGEGFDTITVTVTPTGGRERIFLKLAGLPPESTHIFSPSSGRGAFLSTLQVSASVITPRGTYSLTVAGTAGDLVRQVPLELVVERGFDFSVTQAEDPIFIVRGGSVTNTITVTLTNGSPKVVLLKARSDGGLSGEVTHFFSPVTGTPTYESIFQISTTENTLVGIYLFTVSGEWEELVRSTTFQVVVTDEPLPPPAEPLRPEIPLVEEQPEVVGEKNEPQPGEPLEPQPEPPQQVAQVEPEPESDRVQEPTFIERLQTPIIIPIVQREAPLFTLILALIGGTFTIMAAFITTRRRTH